MFSNEQLIDLEWMQCTLQIRIRLAAQSSRACVIFSRLQNWVDNRRFWAALGDKMPKESVSRWLWLVQCLSAFCLLLIWQVELPFDCLRWNAITARAYAAILISIFELPISVHNNDMLVELWSIWCSKRAIFCWAEMKLSIQMTFIWMKLFETAIRRIDDGREPIDFCGRFIFELRRNHITLNIHNINKRPHNALYIHGVLVVE